MTSTSRFDGWLSTGFLLIVGLPMASLRPWDTADEWWFLQIVGRVLNGQSLYREVFVGVTPLSVWLSALWMAMFGESLLALRTLGAVLFVGIGWVLWRLAARLEVPPRQRGLLLAAYVFMAPPTSLGIGVPYTPLALLFFLSSVDQWVAWMLTPARRQHAVFACVMLGLCGASKQNMGLLAIAPSAVALMWTWRSFAGLRKSKVQVAAGLGLVIFPIFLSMVPVLLAGNTRDMADFVLRNKTSYIHLGQIDYLTGFLSAGMGPWPYALWGGALYLLAPMAAIAWSVCLLGSGSTPKPVVMVLFTAWLATLLSAYPRMDAAHMPVAVPMSLLGLYLLAQRLTGRCRLIVTSLGACMFLVVPAFAWGALQVQLWRSDYGLGLSAFWRGVLVHLPTERVLLEQADAIKEAAGKQPTWLLMPYAARFYLLTDLPNPTRFDYPLATVYGPHGQGEVRGAIASGRIAQVCLDMGDGPLTSYPLVDWVRYNMTVKRAVGPCVLHALPVAGSRRIQSTN